MALSKNYVVRFIDNIDNGDYWLGKLLTRQLSYKILLEAKVYH